ncbi:MAG TPA: hypothetical protein VK668_21485 [Mucilaginibacter sp.]|nr:hypothetical protein [Mucilaginibacter sp.]
MNNHKRKPIKPASNDPVREALGHPNGSGLLEMINGQEEKKLYPGKNTKKPPEDPHIPII